MKDTKDTKDTKESKERKWVLVSMDVELHHRLRVLALDERKTIAETVIGLVEKATKAIK